MIQGIVSNNLSFYCKKCEDNHKVLYMNTESNETFSKRCILAKVKAQAVYMNQNRELIEFKE